MSGPHGGELQAALERVSDTTDNNKKQSQNLANEFRIVVKQAVRGLESGEANAVPSEALIAAQLLSNRLTEMHSDGGSGWSSPREISSWTQEAMKAASQFVEAVDRRAIDPSVTKALEFLQQLPSRVDPEASQWILDADAVVVGKKPRRLADKCIYVYPQVKVLVEASQSAGSTPDEFLRIVTLPCRGCWSGDRAGAWLCYDLFDIWQWFEENVGLPFPNGLHQMTVMSKRALLEHLAGRRPKNPALVHSQDFDATGEPSELPLEDIEAIARALQAYLYVRLLQALQKAKLQRKDDEGLVCAEMLKASARDTRRLLSVPSPVGGVRDSTVEAAHLLLYLYGTADEACRLYRALFPQSTVALHALLTELQRLRAHLLPHAARDHARHAIAAAARDMYLRGARSAPGRCFRKHSRHFIGATVSLATNVYSKASAFLFYIRPLLCVSLLIAYYSNGIDDTSPLFARFLKQRFGGGASGALGAGLHVLFGRKLAEALLSLRALFDSAFLKGTVASGLPLYSKLAPFIRDLCTELITMLGTVFRGIGQLWEEAGTGVSLSALSDKCAALFSLEIFRAWGINFASMLHYLAMGEGASSVFVVSALEAAAQQSILWDLLLISILAANGKVLRLFERFLEYNCRFGGHHSVDECRRRSLRRRRLMSVVSALTYVVRALMYGTVHRFVDSCVTLLLDYTQTTKLCLDDDMIHGKESDIDADLLREALEERDTLYATPRIEHANALGLMTLFPSQKQVRTARRQQSKLVHPDTNGGSAESEAAMMRINDAYEYFMRDFGSKSSATMRPDTAGRASSSRSQTAKTTEVKASEGASRISGAVTRQSTSTESSADETALNNQRPVSSTPISHSSLKDDSALGVSSLHVPSVISSSPVSLPVRRARRQQSKLVHPDTNGGSAESEAAMMRINEAYEYFLRDLDSKSAVRITPDVDQQSMDDLPRVASEVFSNVSNVDNARTVSSSNANTQNINSTDSAVHKDVPTTEVHDQQHVRQERRGDSLKCDKSFQGVSVALHDISIVFSSIDSSIKFASTLLPNRVSCWFSNFQNLIVDVVATLDKDDPTMRTDRQDEVVQKLRLLSDETAKIATRDVVKYLQGGSARLSSKEVDAYKQVALQVVRGAVFVANATQKANAASLPDLSQAASEASKEMLYLAEKMQVVLRRTDLDRTLWMNPDAYSVLASVVDWSSKGFESLRQAANAVAPQAGTALATVAGTISSELASIGRDVSNMIGAYVKDVAAPLAREKAAQANDVLQAEFEKTKALVYKTSEEIANRARETLSNTFVYASDRLTRAVQTSIDRVVYEVGRRAMSEYQKNACRALSETAVHAEATFRGLSVVTDLTLHKDVAYVATQGRQALNSLAKYMLDLASDIVILSTTSIFDRGNYSDVLPFSAIPELPPFRLHEFNEEEALDMAAEKLASVILEDDYRISYYIEPLHDSRSYIERELWKQKEEMKRNPSDARRQTLPEQIINAPNGTRTLDKIADSTVLYALNMNRIKKLSKYLQTYPQTDKDEARAFHQFLPHDKSIGVEDIRIFLSLHDDDLDFRKQFMLHPLSTFKELRSLLQDPLNRKLFQVVELLNTDAREMKYDTQLIDNVKKTLNNLLTSKPDSNDESNKKNYFIENLLQSKENRVHFLQLASKNIKNGHFLKHMSYFLNSFTIVRSMIGLSRQFQNLLAYSKNFDTVLPLALSLFKRK